MDYKKIAASYKEEYYKTLKELIRIESICDESTVSENAPFGKGCREALDYMLNLGKKDGFKVKDYDGYCGVIEYGESEESIGVLAHLDLVTIGEGWTHDPFGAELEEGFVFGRGVADDKGPALSGYFALKALKDNNIIPKRKIMLILGCDEENGMSCMKYYLKHGEIPTCGFTPDADFPLIYGESGLLSFDITGKIEDCPIISMDAGERQNIVLANASATLRGADDTQREEFNYYLKAHQIEGEFNGDIVSFKGKAAHAAECYKGINAGLHLLNYIGISFDNHECRELYNLLSDWRGSKFGIDINGAYMGFLTMNTGIIHVHDNIIKIRIDIRYPNDTDATTLQNKIQKTLDEKLEGFKLVDVSSTEPLFVDPDSEFVQVLLNSYRSISNDLTTPPLAIRGGTYAKCFDNFVAFGPELPQPRVSNIEVGRIHQANEAIYLDDLVDAIAIYTKALIDLQDVKVK